MFLSLTTLQSELELNFGFHMQEKINAFVVCIIGKQF